MSEQQGSRGYGGDGSYEGQSEFPLYQPGASSGVPDSNAQPLQPYPMQPVHPVQPQPPSPYNYGPYPQLPAPMPYPQPVDLKSPALAGVLAFFFGPLGMLYSTVSGGLIMMVLSVVGAFGTLGISLAFTWPVCVIWAVVAAQQHNDAARRRMGPYGW